mgnify:CR=1 FL=1
MKIAKWNGVFTSVLLLLVTGLVATAASVPRPEHPRPDAFREHWATLNGEWQFEIDQEGTGEARGLTAGKDLAAKITVPFCPESRLSGVGNYGLMKNVWYRRMFDVPAGMKGQRVRLHFGGVDYQAWVWVNGRFAGTHVGGNVAFNAGGAHCLKYGMTSNHVLGLKAVLATGEVVEFGGASREQIGPDWTGLFVGNEGLFGIALEITVRLLPKPAVQAFGGGYRELPLKG